MKSPDSPIDRRLACLLGGAIGDALGYYRVEFDRWPEIEGRYGASGIQLEFPKSHGPQAFKRLIHPPIVWHIDRCAIPSTGQQNAVDVFPNR